MNGWRIDELGDAALLLRFGDSINVASNRRIHACAAMVRTQAPEWLTDITPAYASLALHLDMTYLSNICRMCEAPLDVARRWVEERLANFEDDGSLAESPIIEIPVAYGGTGGPDLATLAAHARMPVEEVVARHTAALYSVAMIGFAPGFPYLMGLDSALAMPRHAAPRVDIAAGSVGIGGEQTGIYPNRGPGGWRVIGRTPLQLFDAQRSPPSLLQAGERVRFVAIDTCAFEAMCEHER